MSARVRPHNTISARLSALTRTSNVTPFAFADEELALGSCESEADLGLELADVAPPKGFTSSLLYDVDARMPTAHAAAIQNLSTRPTLPFTSRSSTFFMSIACASAFSASHAGTTTSSSTPWHVPVLRATNACTAQGSVARWAVFARSTRVWKG